MSQQLNNRYYETGDTIRVKTLGVSATDAAANTWIVNAATTYKVEEIKRSIHRTTDIKLLLIILIFLELGTLLL